MRHRKTLRLLALPVGAVALLLSCSVGGLSGETGPIDPTIGSATAGSDPTTSTHASRVATTRPASIEAASPDPTGPSPSVEFSASEATPFECALDGVAFAECTSPPVAAESSGGLDTFGVEGPTLTEDDPTLAIGDVTTPEGNTGTVDAGFTVTLSAASATTVTVNYATAGVSATSGGDFQSSIGTLTFDPGETSEPINVPINGDLVDENDETFTVTLSAPVGATIGDDSGVGTIVDDDPTLAVSDVTVTEGNGGTEAAAFTVTLSAAPSFPVSVDYATANVTATAGSDYTAVSGTLNFAVGETSKTVTVTVQGDNVHEANETFTLQLTNPSNGTFGDSTGVGTITNDDTAPRFAVNDVVVSEAGGSAVLTVSRNRDSQLTVTVDAATANDSATAGSDYTAVPTTTLTFVPGDLSETVTVPVTADPVDEPDERFFVNLSNAFVATISDAQGIATILDDDPSPSLSIDDRPVTEGADATFTVTLSAAPAQIVTVNYASVAGTATSPADFGGVGGALSFAPGETTKTIPVSSVDDALDEDTENYTIALSGATNATIADDLGLGTIADNDAEPSVSISDVTVTEGGTASFTVTLAPVSGRSVSVAYATANGTAIAGNDYTASSGTVSFAAGDTSETVTVPTTGDSLDEVNEGFLVNLSSPSNATVADAQADGAITDDDAEPSLSVADVTVSESNDATFTVTLSTASGRDVTVDYATVDGTASSDPPSLEELDYEAASGTLTFLAGQISKTATVSVAEGYHDELDENFFFNLTNAGAAQIADGQAVGTIVDNDPPPEVSIDDVVLNEADGEMSFTLSKGLQSGRAPTVDYTSVIGSAGSPADFTAVSGTVTFGGPDAVAHIAVPIADDVLDEGNETFTIVLSNPDGLTIVDGTGVGMIVDNDPEPSLSVSDVTVAEGAGNATFTVTLAPVSGRLVTVGFATANGSATAGNDYAATSETLSFEAGETSKQVTVPVTGDIVDENVETFAFNLSGAVNATLADGDGIATITDDDPPPALSINDAVAVESGGNATFTVNLAAPSGFEVSVAYATAHGSATAADYAATSGGLTFAPGQTSKQFTVPITGDFLDEENETFAVNLSGAVNATIADGEAAGVITDDDAPPALSVNDAGVIEGDAGTVNANFTVSLSAPSGRTVTANFATAGGTALSGSDYVARNGTVTFAPGETSQQLSVTVNGDALAEVSETYFLNLSGATNANISDNQGVGTIIDDDGDPVLFVDDVTVTEGQSGTVNANFTVNLSAASGQTVSVGYVTADGTATAGADYTANGGSLVFNPGVISRPLTVQVKSDTSDEIDESFLVNLTDPVNAEIADAEGLGTILDDDLPPSLSVNDVAVVEGHAGTVAATFAITLNAPSGKSVFVHYATSDAAATAPADYAPATGTLSFAAGETTKTVVVTVNGDVLNEVNEGFTLNLANASNATIGDPSGAGTITDDDPQPTLSIDDVTLVESDTGSVTAVFTAGLSGASGRTVSVNYATANGTAVAPADYAATSGSLSFAPGETTKTVTVTVNGDALDEENETFTVGLSGAAGATVTDASGLGTITDNDVRPALSVNDITVTEGNAGTVAANFSISLSAPSGRSVSVRYATANGSALAPGDYQAPPATTLTFTPGQTSQQVIVLVNGDTLDEVTETYSVNLSNETNATIANGQGGGTILDDDAPPTLAINDLSVIEGQSGTVNANMTVTLSAASGQTVSVGYTTADGTASAGADYTAGGGNIVFEPGVTSRPLTIPVKSDTLNELDETFFVNLADPTNATTVDDQGEITITDDDGPATASINDVTVAEGSSGTVEAAFTVSLKAPSGQPVTLNYATADAAATAPTDYRATTGMLTFAPGETAKTVTVTVESDALDEVNETYVVNLSNPGNATIADAQGVGTISDDDDPPALGINDVILAEGDAGGVNAIFTVSLGGVSGRTVTVNYATANRTATAPDDYDDTSGTLSFAPSETTKTIAVSVHADTVFEQEESFVVNLTNAVAALLVDAQGIATVTNDDPAPPVPPPPPPTPDTTAPGEITNVRVVNGDGSVTVTWRNPSDIDFQRVSAVRIKAGAAVQNLPRYEGRGTTFTDRGLKNGLPYRYRIRTYDGAGNVSAGVAVAALPKAALFGPPKGATITSPPTLRWKAVRGATYYNVQLYRVGRGGQAQAVTATKVLSAWPNGTSYKLRRTWRFGGKTYRLTAGSYRWYVWPGLARRSAKKYGPMVGESTFTVKPTKKRR